MVIVETIALSTMVCNDLVMPVLLRFGRLAPSERKDLTGMLLTIRRGSIIFVLLLGYLYFRLIGESYALVTIGLVSFVAAAQFAPAILLGIYWKGASRPARWRGSRAASPSGSTRCCCPRSRARAGCRELRRARARSASRCSSRTHLFGLAGLDPITHAVFWSMLVNVGLFVGVSLFGRQSMHRASSGGACSSTSSNARARRAARALARHARVSDLKELLARFVGRQRADAGFRAYSSARAQRHAARRDAGQLRTGRPFAERQLAGAIGAASARVMVSSMMREEMRDIDELMQILDETSQVIVYCRRLEQKSRELEAATRGAQSRQRAPKELDS